MSCPFCNTEQKILENKKAFALYDKYPVNKGHLLIIPKKHVTSYFATTHAEKKALDDLIIKGKELIDKNISLMDILLELMKELQPARLLNTYIYT